MTGIMFLMSIIFSVVWIICYEFLIGFASPVSSNTLSAQSIKQTHLSGEMESEPAHKMAYINMQIQVSQAQLSMPRSHRYSINKQIYICIPACSLVCYIQTTPMPTE